MKKMSEEISDRIIKIIKNIKKINTNINFNSLYIYIDDSIYNKNLDIEYEVNDKIKKIKISKNDFIILFNTNFSKFTLTQENLMETLGSCFESDFEQYNIEKYNETLYYTRFIIIDN
jgi:hypothetical protein